MIVTRIKKKQVIKNGVYIGSVFSIKEFKGNIVISFTTSAGKIDTSLPVNEQSVVKLGKIAYLGGIKKDETVSISSLINLKLKITVSGGKITKLS